jgi:glycerophosphoryl diester phosphodiesterase
MKAIKPLLSDLIDSVEAYLIKKNLPRLSIILKPKVCLPGDNWFHPVPSEFAELLMAVIKEKKIEDRVIIQSFDFRSLKYIHEKYPSIKTSMLIEDSGCK